MAERWPLGQLSDLGDDESAVVVPEEIIPVRRSSETGQGERVADGGEGAGAADPVPVEEDVVVPRRSARERRPPDWYVP